MHATCAACAAAYSMQDIHARKPMDAEYNASHRAYTWHMSTDMLCADTDRRQYIIRILDR